MFIFIRYFLIKSALSCVTSGSITLESISSFITSVKNTHPNLNIKNSYVDNINTLKKKTLYLSDFYIKNIVYCITSVNTQYLWDYFSFYYSQKKHSLQNWASKIVRMMSEFWKEKMKKNFYCTWIKDFRSRGANYKYMSG